MSIRSSSLCQRSNGGMESRSLCRPAIPAAMVLRASISAVIGPVPPGTGVIAPATPEQRFEIGIAGDSLVDHVDAEVEHRRARTDQIGGEETRLSHCQRDDVCISRIRRQITRSAVAHGDGRVSALEQCGERATDHVASTDHHHTCAVDRDTVVIEQARHRHSAYSAQGTGAPGADARR